MLHHLIRAPSNKRRSPVLDDHHDSFYLHARPSGGQVFPTALAVADFVLQYLIRHGPPPLRHLAHRLAPLSKVVRGQPNWSLGWRIQALPLQLSAGRRSASRFA